MAMLADKKSREKWSQDPRNTLWSNDTTKFGYRMLQKMGWAEGKGLGVHEDGSKEHVKVRRKSDAIGLGGNKGRDDDWISHQDDFNQILANLSAQQASPSHEVKVVDQQECKDMLHTATESKRLVYHKFLRSKDMKSVSTQDLDCVLGRKRTRCSSLEQSELGEQSEDTEISHGITTITRRQSVQDYLLSKRGKGQAEEVVEGDSGKGQAEGDSDCGRKTKRRKKRHSVVNAHRTS